MKVFFSGINIVRKFNMKILGQLCKNNNIRNIYLLFAIEVRTPKQITILYYEN